MVHPPMASSFSSAISARLESEIQRGEPGGRTHTAKGRVKCVSESQTGAISPLTDVDVQCCAFTAALEKRFRKKERKKKDSQAILIFSKSASRNLTAGKNPTGVQRETTAGRAALKSAADFFSCI